MIFCGRSQPTLLPECTWTYGWRGDVRKIGRDTWSVDDIVQGELSDQWRGLEEEGQWLLRQLSAVYEWRSMKPLTCPIPPEAPATTVNLSVQFYQPYSIARVSHTGFDSHVCDCGLIEYLQPLQSDTFSDNVYFRE